MSNEKNDNESQNQEKRLDYNFVNRYPNTDSVNNNFENINNQNMVMNNGNNQSLPESDNDLTINNNGSNKGENQSENSRTIIVSIVLLVIIGILVYVVFFKMDFGENKSLDENNNNMELVNKKFQNLSFSVPSDFGMITSIENYVTFSSKETADGLCTIALQKELAYNNDIEEYLKNLISDSIYNVSADINNIEISKKIINGNSWYFVIFPSAFNTHSFYASMNKGSFYGMEYFGENDIHNYCNNSINSIVNSLKFN